MVLKDNRQKQCAMDWGAVRTSAPPCDIKGSGLSPLLLPSPGQGAACSWARGYVPCAISRGEDGA
jgi:hypothetical protein